MPRHDRPLSLSSGPPEQRPPEQPPLPSGLQQALPTPRPEDDQGILAWMFGRGVDVVVLVMALLNLTAVFFDYSYVTLRPTYQVYAPGIVERYDPMKGIDPDRTMQDYIKRADFTLAAVAADPAASSTARALVDMQEASKVALKDEDAFTIGGQRGVLERVKKLAEKHMAQNASVGQLMGQIMLTDKATNSPTHLAKTPAEAAGQLAQHATLSLTLFWTPQNLVGRADTEGAWFDKRLKPLLDRAYYRHYGEDGQLVEEFWRVDLAFACFFALELLLRAIWVLGIQGSGGRPFKQRWNDFTAARWMDFIYFLPLILYVPVVGGLLPSFIRDSIQLVRMFSVGYRMQRLGLINPVEVAQAKVKEVMDLITDQVNVKLLSNYQESVEAMDMAATLKSLTPAQREQLTVLIQRNMTMVLRDVLPEITPQIEKLIMRAAGQALDQAPAYKQLKRLPFFGALPERMLPTLVAEVLAGTQVTMLKAINDAENMKVTNELIDAATESLLTHMAEVGTEAEVKRLLVDLLEEQKRKVLAKHA